MDRQFPTERLKGLSPVGPPSAAMDAVPLDAPPAQPLNAPPAQPPGAR
jgi:hypothetical protein